MVQDVARQALEAALAVSLAAGAWHHLGYPAFAVLWARLRPRPLRPAGDPAPKVTVLTAAHNERTVIADKIENLLELDYDDIEFVLISDGSTDGTAEIMAARREPRLKTVILEARRGKAAALERGLQEATGDVVVVSDANTRTPRDAIRRLVAPLADPSVGLTSGDVAIEPDARSAQGAVGRSEGLYWRYEKMIRTAESRAGSTVNVVGALMAVRRELFHLPPGTVNDDVRLALSVISGGRRALFVPEAVCFRRPSLTMSDERRRRERMTAGRYQALADRAAWPWRQPQALIALLSHKALRLLMPLFMVVALLANLLLALQPQPDALIMALLGGQLSFYALALIGALQDVGRVRWRPAALAWYVTSGHLSALLGLARYLRGGQSVLWRKVAR